MSVDRVRVEVLGPLRVRDAAGRDLTPSGALQRRLLALLVLRRGSVVSSDAAVEALWPSGLPRDPGAALQNHVLRLRRGLPDGLIESVGSGYRVDPERVQVDADRLVVLLGHEPGDAVAELARMLAGWNGVAYPELDEVDDARAEAARLEELRQRGREVVAEAHLAAGDLDGLVPELVVMAEVDPLRERPRELLMAALAASGRTVEALRVFDEFRRLIGDELGIEPSPALVAQHAALLAGTEPGRRRPARSQLPIPPTPLIGREALASELPERVEAARLVTLVGPGGVGKTRLLVDLGHRLHALRPDRQVVLCELAQADAASAPDLVTAALGIDSRPGTAPIERIVEVLGDDEVIVLLDNCEHVLDSIAELVAGVMRGCPNVRMVATSRERLRVAGEELYAVPTLPTGDEHAPAVELFRQRATAVSPAFEPDAMQRAEIVEIVGRLDGLPLAIELAAARLHTLDVSEVAAGLDQRFGLLSAGDRTSSRHSSLAAAVSWSFDSLDPELQRTFTALSVFSRPFTAADAAAVCGLREAAAGELLSELVERSLVQRAPGRRYVLLETLRAYSADQLVGSDDADHVSERHARWMVDWVEDADRAVALPGRPVLAEVDAAIPELRVALAWLVGHGLMEHAGRLVVGLVNYGFFRLRPDVLRWADTVLAADPNGHVSVAPALWAASAYAAWMGGDVKTSAELIDRAFQAELTAGRGRSVPRVRVIRGNIGLFEGRLSDAAEWYRQAIDATADDEAERLLSRATLLLALGYAGDESVVDLADQLLLEVGDARTAYAAYVWYCAGEADLSFDVDRARVRLLRAIELAEASNASFVLGIAGASKASIEARSGDPDVAMADYRWLIEHWRRAGMWSTQWTMLRSVATLLERVGRHHDAAVLEGAVRNTQAGHRIFGADEVALDELGARLREALGDDAYADAVRQGAVLDGSAAVEHALRAL
jgi:predicted ATPase/DNA-binding SARP family transcriptional activator